MDNQRQTAPPGFAEKRKILSKKEFRDVSKYIPRVRYAIDSEFWSVPTYYEGVPDKIVVSAKIVRIFFVERNGDGDTIMTIQAISYEPEKFAEFLASCGLISHEELLGRKISFSGTASFHPVHGASIKITSMYPELFVDAGDAESRQFLNSAKSEGISERMKSLPFPSFPLRIAVIGASEWNGIAEFLEFLWKSAFAFSADQYPVDFRGQDTEWKISGAVRKIADSGKRYAAVAIVRRHGDSGWNAWFGYVPLAKALVALGIPVFVGASRSAPSETPLSAIAVSDTENPEGAARAMVSYCESYASAIGEDFRAILGHAEKTSVLFLDAVKEIESICYLADARAKVGIAGCSATMRSVSERSESQFASAERLCREASLAISAQSPQSLMRMGYAVLVSEKTGKVVKRPSSGEPYCLETKNWKYSVTVNEKKT